MQGIKVSTVEDRLIFLKPHIYQVLVTDPVPVTVVKGGAFEDTLLLLAMVKEQQLKDNKEGKVW